MELKQRIEHYFDRLFPICRSLSGNGVRETFEILKEIIPLQLHEIPSGKKVFDWTVPKEWNIRDAYILDDQGKKFCDFKVNNLHVVSYSSPIRQEMEWSDLESHLFTLPEMPGAIPYRTTYYKENWGFCISYHDFIELKKSKKFTVVIDATLQEGSITYGDYVLPGKSKEEILFTTYTCHPSMANNELSGVLVTAFLYEAIKAMPDRNYTYRFIFVPETIGSIHYLFLHGEHFRKHLKGGYVVTCVGDAANFNFKVARDETAMINRLSQHVLTGLGYTYKVHDFRPLGSDERQYCSPGFNLPVSVLSRSIFHQYKEYHTSLDNKDFIDFEAMVETIGVFAKFAQAFELNQFYVNQEPYCEPQLGKRGLYPEFGGMKDHEKELVRTMYLLNYADGKHDLLSIAEKTGDLVFDYKELVQKVMQSGLLTVAG
jgi:aminopeptidase-like protein